MGCTPFREHWDLGLDDLIVRRRHRGFESAGIGKDDVDAYWLGTAQGGMSGITLARPAAAPGQAGHPGRELLRHRIRGAAPGGVRRGQRRLRRRDGARRREDEGLRLPGPQRDNPPNDGTGRTLTAAAMFSMVAPAYAASWASTATVSEAMARVAQKNHANGARNPRAQFRREVSLETIATAPRVAGSLGVFDCAGVADGAAAAIVCRAEDAHRYTAKPLYVKALSFVAGNGSGLTDPTYDYTTFPRSSACAADAYAQAGITDPGAELALAEVHDCFTITELVLMEDLGFTARGTAWKDVLDGAFDLHGELPVNPDGGLKSFGHPVGASGLRMMFEAWLQLRGEAGDERQIDPAAQLARSPTTSAATPARW